VFLEAKTKERKKRNPILLFVVWEEDYWIGLKVKIKKHLSAKREREAEG
jgi:hypothetical protein